MDAVDDILDVVADPQTTARRRTKPPIEIEEGRKLTRTPTRRVFHDASRTDAAIDALEALPAEGETWHCLMAARFDGFDLIDAMLAHAQPATIAEDVKSISGNHGSLGSTRRRHG